MIFHYVLYNVTPEWVSERLKQLEERVNRDTYYRALEYVHDDGR